MINNKAQAGLIAVIIIIVALFFIGWLININSRECNSNTDCEEEQYCGSDFSCHQIPIIEKTIIKRSITLPVLIICATIIAIVVIWRWDNLFGKKKIKEEIETTETESPEAYYSSQFQYSAK